MPQTLTEGLFACLTSAAKLSSTTDVPESTEACYAIQADTIAAYAAHEGIGGGAAYGWKIGATNAGARTGLGADAPFYGKLLKWGHRDTDGSLNYAAMGHAVVECEFAVELKADLPARAEPYSIDEVKAAAERVILSIEVVSTRFDSFPGAGVKRYICDNAAAGGWVEGPSSKDWIETDFNAVAVSLIVDGETVATGNGTAIDDGPFGMLAWLANQGVGLKAGEIVTTGTATKPTPVGVGAEVVAKFEGLGQVGVSFV